MAAIGPDPTTRSGRPPARPSTCGSTTVKPWAGRRRVATVTRVRPARASRRTDTGPPSELSPRRGGEEPGPTGPGSAQTRSPGTAAAAGTDPHPGAPAPALAAEPAPALAPPVLPVLDTTRSTTTPPPAPRVLTCTVKGCAAGMRRALLVSSCTSTWTSSAREVGLSTASELEPAAGSSIPGRLHDGRGAGTPSRNDRPATTPCRASTSSATTAPERALTV